MTATDISDDTASGRRIWIPIAAISIVGAALVALANLAILWLGGEAVKAGFSADPTPIRIEIAGTTLWVPQNMIRFADQRRPGPKDRLDLVVHWPSLQGYSDRHADAFDDVSVSAPLIFVSIAARRNDVDSTTRLIGLYTRFFDDPGRSGPAGLIVRNLRPGSGYDNEEIHFEPGSTAPFAARCTRDGDGLVPVTCLRDIHLGDRLAAAYRFRKPLIVDWNRFDPAIRLLVERMRVRP